VKKVLKELREPLALGLALLSIVISTVIGIAAWPKATPEFKGDVGSTDEIAEFDKFITEHTHERVRVSVTFPNQATIQTTRDEGSVRTFVLGDLACKPARESCEKRYWYRVLRMRSDDRETVFGWGDLGGDAGNGWFLRGTYFVSGSGTGTGGTQWRAIQAVRDGSS